MRYEEAVARLLDLSDIERSAVRETAEFKLDGVRRVLHALHDPHLKYRTIHVAGTKGKGSTCALLESVLRQAGIRAGLYTSPHLHRFNERIRVDGREIGDEEFAGLAEDVEAACREALTLNERLSTFEMLTVMAFLAFQRARVEWAIVEVGLGGRLDATNVVAPGVCAITPVSIDHEQYLGSSLSGIAREKAGILKHGCVLVLAPQADEAGVAILDEARRKGTTVIDVARDWRWTVTDPSSEGFVLDAIGPGVEYKGLLLPLAGAHQAVNAVTALAVLNSEPLRGVELPSGALRNGMARVWWPGRLETVALNPRVVVDGAHNVASMKVLRDSLREHYAWESLVLVLGVMSDKDAEGMMAEICPIADEIIATASRNSRAMPATGLAAIAERYGRKVSPANDPKSALAAARSSAGPDGLVCVSGSLYLVAEVREAMGLTRADQRFAAHGQVRT